MSISNLIKIPDDLHRDYIKHALAGGSQKYKFWSFKPKGTTTSMHDSSYGSLTYNSETGYMDYSGDFTDKNIQTQIQNNLGEDQLSKYQAEDGHIDTGFLSGILPGSEKESILRNAINTASQIKTDAVYYPFSDTFKDFVFNTYYGINQQHSKFFENIPTVTVRAYIPETILGLFVNVLGDIGKNLKEGIKNVTGSEGKNNEQSIKQGIFEKMKSILLAVGIKLEGNFLEFERGISTPGGYQTFVNDMIAGLRCPGGEFHGTHDNLIIHLPYILYYKILKAQTNNIYEFPAIVNSIFKSGSYGWSNGHQFNLGAEQSGVLSFLANSIGTTVTPVFDPRHNGSDEPVGFTINLDLINDNINHARNNYNLVQSLVLYNMWVQYGLVQGPGSLYDVKIAGGQRFLMCTGNISVTNKGILRKIPSSQASGWLPWKEETRIPDVYSVNIEFKSLLPNNLNNYMISVYSGNYMNTPGKSEEGSISEFIENVGNAIQHATNTGKNIIKMESARGSERQTESNTSNE